MVLHLAPAQSLEPCTGHEAFLVGGAVRDILLGRKPKDFDVLTTATPVQVASASCLIYCAESTDVSEDGRLLSVLMRHPCLP